MIDEILAVNVLIAFIGLRSRDGLSADTPRGCLDRTVATHTVRNGLAG